MKTKTKSVRVFELRVVYLMRSYCGGGTRKKAAGSYSTMLKHSAQFIRVHDAIAHGLFDWLQPKQLSEFVQFPAF